MDEYRKFIYGSSSNSKPKHLSTSLSGSGSNSAKYLPSHNKSTLISSTSTHTPSSHSSNKTQVIDKPELTKKYSH